MGKIKFTNRTNWNTRDLRRLVEVGLREEVGVYLEYWVEIYSMTPNRRYTGHGAIHALWMDIGAPLDYVTTGDGTEAPLDVMPSKDVIRMARTLAHEVQHNKGERHKEMVFSRELPVPWVEKLIAEGFQIRRKAKKAKPARDLQAERFEHARAKLAEHERKMKRARTLVQKWKRKVRYYERVLAARQQKSKSAAESS
jgi:hypothetical protein